MNRVEFTCGTRFLATGSSAKCVQNVRTKASLSSCLVNGEDGSVGLDLHQESAIGMRNLHIRLTEDEAKALAAELRAAVTLVAQMRREHSLPKTNSITHYITDPEATA
jgi:hypothetical protein